MKRLIKRTDMRNSDPLHKRYTSLAWAAVLGHEETFEFLLTSGHDDQEISKVSFLSHAVMLRRLRTMVFRMLITTPFCYSWRTQNHPLAVHTWADPASRTSWVLLYGWRDCTTTAIKMYKSLIGPTLKARPPCI